MPRTTFDPSNKEESQYSDFPRLKLDAGARARIVLIETEPLFEYVHTLRAPSIEDGQVVTETVTRKNGNPVERTVFNFVGRHLCLGDVGTIKDKGSDPDTCPVCAKAKESDAFTAPERRFAAHIIKYQLRPGGFQVAEPFTAMLEAWVFGNQIFDKISDFSTEWGDMRTHDLNLGPCTQAQFQKFDIQVAAEAEWLKTDERKKYVIELYQNNKSEDLSPLLGRKVDKVFLKEDIDTVLRAHRLADKVEGSGQSSGQAIDDLLNQASAVQMDGITTGDEAPISANLDDLLGSTPTPTPASTTPDASTTEAPVSPEASAPEASAPAAPEKATLSFDDMLADLS